jgi:hypothetical protein
MANQIHAMSIAYNCQQKNNFIQLTSIFSCITISLYLTNFILAREFLVYENSPFPLQVDGLWSLGAGPGVFR